jgi:hypothetical protein
MIVMLTQLRQVGARSQSSKSLKVVDDRQLQSITPLLKLGGASCAAPCRSVDQVEYETSLLKAYPILVRKTRC